MKTTVKVVCGAVVCLAFSAKVSSQMSGGQGLPTPRQTERFDGMARYLSSQVADNQPDATAAIASASKSSGSVGGDTNKTPEVTFRNGLLGIRAENAPMGEVLLAVQRATGTSVDFPEPANERVTVSLPPAESLETWRSLLRNSRYDYILVTSRQQPNVVERVLLAARRDTGTATTSVNLPEVEQRQAAPARRTTEGPTPQNHQIIQEQQRQFEKMFGACTAQGCDAS